MAQNSRFPAARDLAESAAAVLGPEAGLFPEVFADADPVGLGDAVRTALRLAVTRPAIPAGARLINDLAQIPLAAVSHWLGGDLEPPVEPDPKDRRFADPAWTTNPAFYAIRQAYLAAARCATDVVGAAEIDADSARKAELATDLMIDACAPTNFLPTNPAAIKRALDTGGASVLRGARAFIDDLLHNNGRPRQVDSSAFEVGRNLAATPAKVVFRNDLMELLQYEPQTDQVHATPLLASPPWINKYYIMDLAPERSFIEWAVQHGRTVFAISYRNPTAEMSDITMDDYLLRGPQTALTVIEEITGAETIDIVGLCLGGALTAITAAYLAQSGDTRIGTVTLLNTMLDYAEPGPLGVFTDQHAIDRLESKMRRDGVLPAESMAGTFDVLRANDLIFNYVVSNWLMGQDPPAFDILAWNADNTRMPSAMHTFYLRNIYGENKLAAAELDIGGQTIDLSTIKSPTYIVSAINDHIVPWESAYKTARLVGGPARFVLVNGGHIAGIVSPPGPKAWHMTAPDNSAPDEPAASGAAWQTTAERRTGSWWEDWTVWSEASAGPLRWPPQTGSRTYPVLGDGPGEYVRT